MFDGGISLVPIMDTYFSVCCVRTPFSREPFTCLYVHKRLEKISLFYFFFSSPNENESIEDKFTARKKENSERGDSRSRSGRVSAGRPWKLHNFLQHIFSLSHSIIMFCFHNELAYNVSMARFKLRKISEFSRAKSERIAPTHAIRSRSFSENIEKHSCYAIERLQVMAYAIRLISGQRDRANRKKFHWTFLKFIFVFSWSQRTATRADLKIVPKLITEFHDRLIKSAAFVCKQTKYSCPWLNYFTFRT